MLVTGGALPLPVNDTVCSMPGMEICAMRGDVEIMRQFMLQFDEKCGGYSAKRLVKELMGRLGVTTEAAIWEHRDFRNYIGTDVAEDRLRTHYKTQGPHSSTALLDNNNIDITLAQWALHGKKRFGLRFHHIPFQMIDFAQYGSELARTDLAVLKRDYDCFGVVLNTDIHTGRGKHWFCIYGDLKHAGTEADPIKVEYFNSSGNPPRTEVEVWLERTRVELLRDHNIYMDVVRSVPRRLQYSNTECGMWSLLYILSRLSGKPPGWFYKVDAGDADMISYRASLFR
jgi:hypothetical protein